ncbi:MAG: acyltransferase family protein [Pseudomonadota bacterium]
MKDNWKAIAPGMVNTLFKELVKPLPKANRLLFLDHARGIALLFMIYSHALRNFSSARWYVRGDLMEFQNFTLLFTKGAAPLFIITFGFLIAYIYTHHTRKIDFTGILKKFWFKAGIIFIAYRLCAYFESFGRKLSYQFFAVGDTHWIEILMFYVILLIFTPFVILAYKKVYSVLFFLISAGLIFFSLNICQAGYNNQFEFLPKDFNLLFFGLKHHYNFPIFPYIGVYMIGFVMGVLYRFSEEKEKKAGFILIVSLVGVGLLIGFYGFAHEQLLVHLLMIKNNVYKHPPNFYYLLFSVGIAIVILSLTMIREQYFGFRGSFISDMGKRPLFLFVIHFFLIFIIFTQSIGRLQVLTIGKALTYTCFTLALCYLCFEAYNFMVQLIYQERS